MQVRAGDLGAVAGEQPQQCWHRHGLAMIGKQLVCAQHAMAKAGSARDLEGLGPGGDVAKQDRAGHGSLVQREVAQRGEEHAAQHDREPAKAEHQPASDQGDLSFQRDHLRAKARDLARHI